MKQKFAANISIKILNVALAALATVSWARIGGVEVFGVVSGFTFATFIIAEFIDKGNSTTVARNAVREKLEYSQWPSEIPRIITRYTICLIPLLIMLVVFPISNRLTYALLLMNMPFLMINIYFQQFAYGYSKLKQVNAGIIIEKIFWFTAIPLSLLSYKPALAIPISILLGSLAQNLYALVEIKVSTKPQSFKFSKSHFRITNKVNRPHGNIDISASRIIGNLFYLDISLIGLLANSTAAGHYAVGARLRSILTIGFTSVSDLIGPKLIDQIDWRRVVISRDHIVILALNTLGCTITFLLAQPLTILFLGSEFLESVFFVKCFSITCLVLGIVTILRAILISLFFEWFVGRVYILGFLLNACCFPLVIYQFGSQGAALLTLVTQVLIALLLFVRLIKIK